MMIIENKEKNFIASAPGSLMLMGEHAVLAGKLALCGAIDRRITVQLNPRKDNKVSLTTQIYPIYHTNLADLIIEQPYQFVLATLLNYRAQLPNGCDITIYADFSSKLGFGSSAAVTVALVRVIHAWLGLSFEYSVLFYQARKIIRQVQGRGSGSDVAASLLGGIIIYQQDAKNEPQKLTSWPELALVYCGYKTPTPVVIEKVAQNFAKTPDLLQNIYEKIDEQTQKAAIAWQQKNWQEVGRLFNEQFIWQQQLGVSDVQLNYLLDKLDEHPHCLGAKISGSGLGDCVIALGNLPNLFPDKHIPKAQQFTIIASDEQHSKVSALPWPPGSVSKQLTYDYQNDNHKLSFSPEGVLYPDSFKIRFSDFVFVP